MEGTFTTRNLAPNDIKKVVDEVNKISHKAFGEEKDLIGRVYEYFLKEFAVNATKEEGEYYTPHDVVQMIASMIEKETSIKSEKPMISSVIHNRINLGIIAPEDVPEIPLCSPGQDSIIAALYPSEDENIYYVLSDKLDGTHVFTSDEAEYKSLLDAYNAAKAAREEELDKKQSGAEDQDDNAADQNDASQQSSEEE